MTEGVFLDEACNFAVSLPTAAEAFGAEDYSLGFLCWLLLGFESEQAWKARCAAMPTPGLGLRTLSRARDQEPAARHRCISGPRASLRRR